MLTQIIKKMVGVCVLCWLVVVAPALASEEQYVPWSEVSFTAAAPAPFGEVKVVLKVDPATGHMSKATIRLSDGKTLKTLVVPMIAFADTPAVRIHEVKTTFEVGYDPQPWFYVKIPYGDPVLVAGTYRWPEVAVAVQDDKLVYFSIKTPKPDGNYDWKQTPFK